MSERETSAAERLLELIAVLLLGITTVGTAWCGFQASRWNAQSGDLSRAASAQQVEGARLFGLATQRVTYDSIVVAKYAEASLARNTSLLKFYRQFVVRPDFLPVLDRWEAAVKAGRSAAGVFEDKEYLAGQFADYNKAQAAAGQAARDSQHASEVADGYVGTTILLAVALFFAGVTSSFVYRPARVLLLIAAPAPLRQPPHGSSDYLSCKTRAGTLPLTIRPRHLLQHRQDFRSGPSPSAVRTGDCVITCSSRRAFADLIWSAGLDRLRE